MKPVSPFLGIILLAAGCTNVNPVYYEVATGKNYEHCSWHVAKSEAAFAKVQKEKDIYNFYTIEQKKKQTVVKRVLITPSGDWVEYLDYTYNKAGQLEKIADDYRTFNGLSRDVDTEEGGLTRFEKEFYVSSDGKLKLVSQKITDLKTGKAVDRGCFESEIQHWMKLSDLPIQAGGK